MKIVLISTDESRVGMGVRTLSACLLERGFQTSIVLMATSEESYKGFDWNDLILECKDAGLVGISCMTHGVVKAREVKDVLSKNISAPIIIGGIHASLDPESLINDFDLVCHGEGEDSVVELAQRIAQGTAIDDIPGIWIKKDHNVIRNAAIELKKTLNEYPFPDYDLNHQLLLEANRLVRIRPIVGHISIDDFVVLGSRGCPHHCTYCCNRKIKSEFPWRKKVVHYSIDYLMDHLKAVKERFPQVRSFWIEDDTFFAKSTEEIVLFSDRYKNEINLPFQILISPWTYKKEKVDPLIKVGMTKLIMGIQSGSERVNAEVYDRKITRQRLMEIAASLHEYTHLKKCYDFIGMNPFENAEDLINTIGFLKELPYP